jgi:hypothetical protein
MSKVDAALERVIAEHKGTRTEKHAEVDPRWKAFEQAVLGLLSALAEPVVPDAAALVTAEELEAIAQRAGEIERSHVRAGRAYGGDAATVAHLERGELITMTARLAAEVRRLTALQQGAEMLREDHDTGIALLRAAERERDDARKALAEAEQGATLYKGERDHALANVAEVEKALADLREKARAVEEDAEESSESADVCLVSASVLDALKTEAEKA